MAVSLGLRTIVVGQGTGATIAVALTIQRCCAQYGNSEVVADRAQKVRHRTVCHLRGVSAELSMLPGL